MVRIIIEHKTKDVDSLINFLWRLRTEAMKQRGYVTGETLVNIEDPSSVLVVSTWEKAEDWDNWNTSETRTKLTKPINDILLESYKVRKFHYYLAKEKRVWSF